VRSYFVIVGALFALSIVSYNRVILLFSIIFVVPGVILFVASTALFYALGAGPAAYLWCSQRPRAALVVGVLCEAAVALGPGYRGRQELEAFEASAITGDFAREPTLRAKSFEIPLDGWAPSDDLVTRSPDCSILCRDLLYRAGVESVFVEANGSLWRYRLDWRDRCSVRYRDLREFGASASVDGKCLVGEQVAVDGADVKLRFDPRRDLIPPGFSERSTFWRVVLPPQTWEVAERIGDGFQLVERRTAMQGAYAPTPLYVLFTPESPVPNDYRPLVASRLAVGRTADWREIVSRRYGLSFDSSALAERPVTFAEVDAARRVLTRASGNDNDLSRDDLALVRQVAEKVVRQSSFGPDDTDFLRMLLRHPLLDGAKFDLGAVDVGRHASAWRDLLPDIVSLFETPSSVGDHDFRRVMSSVLEQLPRAALRIYQSRFERILSDPSRARDLPGVVRRWGEVSDMPKPVLLRLLEDEGVRGAAMVGLCRIALPHDDEIVEKLFDLLPRMRRFDFAAGDASGVATLLLAGERRRLQALSTSFADVEGARELSSLLKWIEAEARIVQCG